MKSSIRGAVFTGLILGIVFIAMAIGVGMFWEYTHPEGPVGQDIDRLDRADATIQAIAKVLLAMGEAQLIYSDRIDEIHAVICASPEPAPAVEWDTGVVAGREHGRSCEQ